MPQSPLMVLDLDGTLIDSRRDIADSLNFALEAEGFPSLSQEKVESLVGWGARRLVREALGAPTEEQLERVFRTFWKRYGEHLLDATALYPQALDFLERSAGWRKALVTNKPYTFTRRILEGLEIAGYFEWVVGGDSLPVQKPDPTVLAAILRDSAGRRAAVMVGDSLVDLECGRGAGLTTVMLTHGFGNAAELRAGQPDFLVGGFAELMVLDFFREFEKSRGEACPIF